METGVIAPYAMGAVLNDNTSPHLTVVIVAGSANNQLAEDRHTKLPIKRRMLYAPDYGLNADGTINIYYEKHIYGLQAATAHISGIHDNLIDLFRRANVVELTAHLITDRMAEEKIEAVPISELLIQKIAAIG